MDIYVYVPSDLPGTRNTTNRWIGCRIDQEAQDQGKIFRVRNTGVALKAVESVADPPEKESMPGSLLEVLKEWGCVWMWDFLRLFSNEYWIKGAIST